MHLFHAVCSRSFCGRVKIDGGLGARYPWSSGRPPLDKCQNGAGVGFGLFTAKYSNSLAHSTFRCFTFSGKNIKTTFPR